MILFKTYIHIAICAIVSAMVCYIMKMIRFPGDDLIIRLPDITLHDIVYFNAENFVNLFGLVACTNLCYFISSTWANSILVYHLKVIMLLCTCICFVRCCGHFFTYYKVSDIEKVIDYTIIIIFIINYLLYRFKHASIHRNGTDTRIIDINN